MKCNKVLSHLKHLGTQMAFLQETHLRPIDQFRIRRGWEGQLYHSLLPHRSWAVAIPIHKSVPFSVSEVIADPLSFIIIIIRGRIQNSFHPAIPSQSNGIFINANVTPDVSAATIWESFKAYLRGEIIY